MDMAPMFAKNAFLAVVGADGDDFWLCRVARKVGPSPRLTAEAGFDVHWLEKAASGGDGGNIYVASPTANAVQLKSVVTRVYLKRRRDGSFELSDAQRRRVQRDHS